ncbi:acyl-CoA dehydrogenase (plasmid) [Cupriavidus necator N-1]|uniref:Acyl-CoA dehydrogenase n=1 Tax=Cupriavidus necator (strain ATCC 43291 / DSM 13513 / CCUG 52238 / LMG 8453 / N-1) TaxID=1042878 RepID=F8GX64_CUPNN|nr:acyl-CoA dehydrogenase [Cupriavidus necator]AEI81934.1 acyl-CoA dehydrogenase [Cupriavidus necator N-1]MDX6008255.1 acyl-CoA dehydrogenase [Cupriavidus necator]
MAQEQTEFPPSARLPGDEERLMLQESLRRLLARHWPAERAVEHAADQQALASIWRVLAEQGLTSLGSNPQEGGLREIAVALEELGRVACPAPLIGAALANLALSTHLPEEPAPGEAAALLGALHRGDASVSFAFGSFDGDAQAGCVRFAKGTLHGRTAFVEAASHATHLLVLAEPGPVLAIVPCGAAGLTVTETSGLAVPPLATVSFDRVAAAALQLPPGLAEDLRRIGGLALLARALGAARQGFDMAVAYAKERQQFGQPIGRFQAIQHKLANCLMALEAARLMLQNAASTHDLGSENWRILGAAARAFAGPAVRQVSLETHHTLGAIGYSEEHEAPRHFRRTHADLARHGGVRQAREELARALLDQGATLPEYDLGPAGNAFRDEVRAWLKENWSSASRKREHDHAYEEWGYDTQFTRLLGRKGWNTMSWPREYGGQGRTPYEQLAFMEEIQQAGAPMGGRGDIQAHALMAFGTDEQKAEFLPRLARGEITFCLGYSEPGSGSDLASMQTTAMRDGDEWVINGQKIWTTAAEKADYMWLAARTDRNAARPHAGISIFIVPMNSPGLTVIPSMAMYGHTFCQEFLDNVRVPASALVGKVNDGWTIVTSALATERMMMGSFIANARSEFERLVRCVCSKTVFDGALADDGAVRDRIGALAAEVEAGRQLFMNSIALAEQGRVPVHEAAMSKAYMGELMERLGQTALDILGTGATLSEDAEGAVARGKFEQLLRYAILTVIGGGTAEIQRNLIAQRGLGLPR